MSGICILYCSGSVVLRGRSKGPNTASPGLLLAQRRRAPTHCDAARHDKSVGRSGRRPAGGLFHVFGPFPLLSVVTLGQFPIGISRLFHRRHHIHTLFSRGGIPLCGVEFSLIGQSGSGCCGLLAF